MLKKLFDLAQLKLHLMGFHRTATFVGRWGSTESYARLRAVDFDPTLSNKNNIDIENEIVWPRSKLDIN